MCPQVSIAPEGWRNSQHTGGNVVRPHFCVPIFARFLSKDNTHAEMSDLYNRIEAGECVDVDAYVVQKSLLAAE
jgi:hypothetical protein